MIRLENHVIELYAKLGIKEHEETLNSPKMQRQVPDEDNVQDGSEPNLINSSLIDGENDE